MGRALVTGATAGLGREFCWELAARRHDLVLVARDQERLEKLAEALWQVGQVKAEVLPADLATESGVQKVVERLQQPHQPVGLLVNNAGFGQGQPFMETTVVDQQRALDVMVRAVLETSHAAARAMRDRGYGAILNVSSVAADTGMGTYSAHKSWVRAFTEGLAHELKGTRVTATVVMPGLMHTEFHARSGQEFDVPEWTWMDAAVVADRALDAVARGKVLYTPGVLYKAAAAALKLTPRSLVYEIVGRMPHT